MAATYPPDPHTNRLTAEKRFCLRTDAKGNRSGGMESPARTALAAIAAGLILAGCGAADPGGATSAAERLYSAHAGDDGATACALLSESTRRQLEQDEQLPCAEAVLELDLEGGRAVAQQAFITEAKVELDGGDSVFVEETPDGWRVTAAGCRPVPDQEAPYDCEVES